MTTLRVATPADTAAIAALEAQIFVTDAWSEQMIAEELRADYRRYWVLEDGNSIVGYAGLLQIGAEADVQTLAVAEEYRGQGLGRLLLNTLQRYALAQGAQEMFLEVRADNPVAIKLYQESGFVELGVRARYYQPDNVDAIIMRARLSAALIDESEKDA